MKLEVDIRKTFGDFVFESSFEVRDNVLAILGASGSGKTLTLKCIAGVETPDEGRIVLGGRVLFDSANKINVPARKRNIGFLFQDYALFPNMTVRQNIACTSKDESKVDDIIERFGLSRVSKLYPAQLSGGQSQRTAIARMLLTDPELIMLDEPFSALDNYLKFRIEQEIFALIEEFSGPIIVVSHDRNEVYRMADYIGVMDGGKLIGVQGKREFFDHPASVGATRLTGCKNVSEVKKVKDDIYRAEDWGINITIPNQNDKDIRYVGYRAHYFEMVEKDEPTNVFRGKIQRIIEDTFSVMVCFRQADNKSVSPDSVLTWVVSKDRWNDIKDEINGENRSLEKKFYLKLYPENLIALER